MRARSAIVAILAVGAAATAFPQSIQNLVLRNSFNPVGAGARGLGMGGAFIAVADDGTASTFNPAGLAQLERSELALVGFGRNVESILDLARAGEASQTINDTSNQGLDFLGLSVPFDVADRNLTFQLSYQRSVDLFGEGRAFVADVIPFRDLGIDRPGTASFIVDAEPQQSGAFHTLNSGLAYQVTDRLSLGVVASYWIAEWTARGTTSFRTEAALAPGAPATQLFRIDTQFEQKQSVRGLNLNTGFLLRYSKLSIGGVLRLPFTGSYDLDEMTESKAFELGQPSGSETVSQIVRSRLHWPVSTGIGIAFRPKSRLTLAVDYSRARWSRTIIENVPEGALLTAAPPLDETGDRADPKFLDLNFFDLAAQSHTTTVDTSQLRAGLEYLLVFSKLVVPLRVGGFRDLSPVPDLSSAEGREITGFTIGTGLNFRNLVLDFAFERRESEGAVGLVRRRGEFTTEGAPQEKVNERRFVASVIYRFGGDDGDPVSGFFKKLFGGGGDEDDEEQIEAAS